MFSPFDNFSSFRIVYEKKWCEKYQSKFTSDWKVLDRKHIKLCMLREFYNRRCIAAIGVRRMWYNAASSFFHDHPQIVEGSELNERTIDFGMINFLFLIKRFAIFHFFWLADVVVSNQNHLQCDCCWPNYGKFNVNSIHIYIYVLLICACAYDILGITIIKLCRYIFASCVHCTVDRIVCHKANICDAFSAFLVFSSEKYILPLIGCSTIAHRFRRFFLAPSVPRSNFVFSLSLVQINKWTKNIWLCKQKSKKT